jgi:ferredoxin-NADP reductase
MIGLFEATGIAVIVGAMAQAAVMLVLSTWRGVRINAAHRAERELFQQRARLLLEAARIERDRRQWSWDGLRKLVIDDKVQEAEGICSFYLRSHDRQPLSPYHPGQHLTCHLRIPGQVQPVVRCYSLSDAPRDDGRYRLTIKRIEVDDGSSGTRTGLASGHLCDRLEPGDIINVESPSGSFVLDPDDEHPVVLIAGGIGITPLLAMINAGAAAGSSRETWLFYGVRDSAQQVMKDHLEELTSQHPNLNLVARYSHPRDETESEHAGFITLELLQQMLPSNNYQYYLCGPPPMMHKLMSELREWGVAGADIHFEAFGPASAAQPAEHRSEASYQVVFARSGTTCEWTEDQGSLLELGEARGVSIPHGCRAGSCGTCVTAIKEGQGRYSIQPGVDPGEGSCLVCIAVPDGPLVLDA